MADAPPVTTSMWSMKSVGIMLKSTIELPATPGVKRRPLTSTSVRLSPRLRRLIVLMPAPDVLKFEFVPLIPEAPTAGKSRSTSATFCEPEASSAAVLTIVMGVGDSNSRILMREPVTTTVSRTAGSTLACCWAIASGDTPSAAAASARNTPRSNFVLRCICDDSLCPW